MDRACTCTLGFLWQMQVWNPARRNTDGRAGVSGGNRLAGKGLSASPHTLLHCKFLLVPFQVHFAREQSYLAAFSNCSITFHLTLCLYVYDCIATQPPTSLFPSSKYLLLHTISASLQSVLDFGTLNDFLFYHTCPSSPTLPPVLQLNLKYQAYCLGHLPNYRHNSKHPASSCRGNYSLTSLSSTSCGTAT